LWGQRRKIGEPQPKGRKTKRTKPQHKVTRKKVAAKPRGPVTGGRKKGVLKKKKRGTPKKTTKAREKKNKKKGQIQKKKIT